ncbi:uncharacterized protein N7469_002200 [Penicillium citrinum]|uniref:Uncharacterized protein n=1 Tax=Penicillium citrinum TaxID=5077 RepID=A0A9W9TV47_PENCI|nr:uncharacterized protein N7469_002200 [Penicillium citrinum]KAJ5240609.1 hypothetical protein N7469_002200 [Penicillium citrinum]
MPHLRSLPNEVLHRVAARLECNEVFALAGSCRNLYTRLQPPIVAANIQCHNSNLLGFAAMHNDRDLAESLLEHGANVNAFYQGKTPVMRALEYSSYDVLQLLLASSALDINLQNRAQESALWYAITYGTCAVLRSLLQVPNLKIDLPHRRGRTALHLAVWWGKTELAHLLLSSGSDPFFVDDCGKSPRAWAWRIGRPSMKWIFVSGRDGGPSLSFYRPAAGYQRGDHNELPLHQAVAHGSADAIKLLLAQKNPALEAHDQNGDTPLHLAVRCRRLEAMEALLDHPQVNINCRDRDDNTPLWLSTFLSHDDMTKRILAAQGIDVNFVGGRGQTQSVSTSLHHVVARRDTVALRWLLEMPGIDLNLGGGVEINATDLADPPLCRAAENGHREAVRLLVRQGESLAVNQSSIGAQDTALCIAARAGDSEMVRILLRHPQIDPNQENRWLQDPLMLAVKGKHMVVVDVLQQDRRLRHRSLLRSLESAEEGLIREILQSRVDDLKHRFRAKTAAPSKWKFAAIINCHRVIASASDFCAVLLLLPIYELSWTKFSDPDSQQHETPS